MGRLNSIDNLPAAEFERVNAAIRQHRYRQGCEVLEELKELGISLTRSALYRYIQRLKKEDGTRMRGNLVVTIVELTTGTVTTLGSTASAASLIQVIQGLEQPSA